LKELGKGSKIQSEISVYKLGRTAAFLRVVQHNSLVAEIFGPYNSLEGCTRRVVQQRKGAATAGKISAHFVEVLEGFTTPRTQQNSVVRNFCVVVNFWK